jgi:hypothetical protein
MAKIAKAMASKVNMTIPVLAYLAGEIVRRDYFGSISCGRGNGFVGTPRRLRR